MNIQELKPINKTDIKHICTSIEALLARSIELKNIIAIMCEYTDIYIIGGALRDIVNNNVIRDIDIIYRPITDFSIEKLQCKYSFNSFGGFKILSDLEIDFWSFENNWYFKNFLSNPTPKDITLGTFFNINSLVLDYKKKYLYYDHYNVCANNKVIDFVSHNFRYIHENPNKPLNIVNCFI